MFGFTIARRHLLVGKTDTFVGIANTHAPQKLRKSCLSGLGRDVHLDNRLPLLIAEEAGIMAGENWTFWLNMTNFALGIVTLLAVVVVAGAVSWDLFFMWLHKVRTGDAVDIRGINMQRLMAEVRGEWGADAHSLSVPGLGLTMADGGEKMDPSEKQPEEKESRRK